MRTRSLPSLLFLAFCASTGVAQTSGTDSPETVSLRVSEGTILSFDLSSDGRRIVFDLLGQLWLVPAEGGEARPVTDAVRDTAEDLDPSFSPDGRRVVFRGERAGRTGLWLVGLDSARPRQLTQLGEPDGYDGSAAWSPDGRLIAFVRAVPPTSREDRRRSAIVLLDPVAGTTREFPIDGLPRPGVRDPSWLRNGRIGFAAMDVRAPRGGRIWTVDTAGGPARPVPSESVQARAPVFTPDGRRVAYFAPDSANRIQVWVQELSDSGAAVGPPIRITNHADVTPTRIRWTPDGTAFLYSADGGLWKAGAAGQQRTRIPFTVQLAISRARRALPPARFPMPGEEQPARGFMGLALSPDGRQIGVLALGKLWVVPVGGTPRAVADVPFQATMLAWAPDGKEAAWAAGAADQEDLFATDLATGATRRITALPGSELFPAYSPDGRHLAFVHEQGGGRLRVIDAHAGEVADTAQTRNLGPAALSGTSPPRWSPESDGLLVSDPPSTAKPGLATFVPLAGERQPISRFPDAPIFLQWTPQHSIVYVRHDRLWQAPFDHTGLLSDPQPLGGAPALYASTSRDGTLLFVSEGGLRLCGPDGKERRLGWPLSYTPPVAAPLLLRNVRVIDGTGRPPTVPQDVLVERGRVARIAPAGSLQAGATRVLDAGGRIAIPGLMDLHAHTDWPDLLPGFLYFGVTTVRDQGASMARLVAYADAIAAGLLPGPRVGYGGFQFYSDWPFDQEQWRGIEPEADPDHIRRAVALAEAFGAQHIKTRTFRRWDINARMIAEAHRRGLRATGHCAQQLPLVAVGMDAKEHLGFCEPRNADAVYDDLVQLYRAAGIGVVPTISYLEFAVRLSERPALLDDDAEVAPFLPKRENFGWMLELDPETREEFARSVEHWRESVARLQRAGVTIGTGTDIWQVPSGVHMELEELVAAGLSPLEAIRAGTGAAARILGAEGDLGTIEVGKRADLILLDADPLADIRNTRRIWQVIQDGHLVDRPAILASHQKPPVPAGK
jgi:imidazolonepropionase-like amidohydrolase/Tol biopolymer transport system component